jgi:thymidylate kinase
MKIVLAFEGMDGSGKTSLAVFTRKLCELHNQRYTLLGRKESYASPLVGRLTALLHEEATNLVPQADIALRLARECQRAALAAAVPSGVVVLDRFVLSLLSLARFHGLDLEPILRFLQDISARAALHATVFVKCPFELARSRVKERSQGFIVRPSRDERFLRRMAQGMEEDFQRGLLTGQQWLVENAQTLDLAEEQLAGYLLPYLQGPGVRSQGSGGRDQAPGIRGQGSRTDGERGA